MSDFIWLSEAQMRRISFTSLAIHADFTRRLVFRRHDVKGRARSMWPAWEDGTCAH